MVFHTVQIVPGIRFGYNLGRLVSDLGDRDGYIFYHDFGEICSALPWGVVRFSGHWCDHSGINFYHYTSQQNRSMITKYNTTNRLVCIPMVCHCIHSDIGVHKMYSKSSVK